MLLYIDDQSQTYTADAWYDSSCTFPATFCISR